MSEEDDASGQAFRNQIVASYRRGFEDGKSAVLAEILRQVQSVVAR